MAKAIVAYAGGDRAAVLNVHADEGEADPLPIALFFRSPEELRDVDLAALDRAKGRVLDVGAGVGSVALALQEGGSRVTAVEVIPEAADIMAKRGVADVREGRVEELPPEPAFDTILVLMNGIAMAGSLGRVPNFLRCLGRLMREGGQILLDSTDLLGTGSSDVDRGVGLPSGWLEGEYPGELHYQLEFQGERGAPFPQVFLDPPTLSFLAEAEGLETEVVWEGEDGIFLARLRHRPVSRE